MKRLSIRTLLTILLLMLTSTVGATQSTIRLSAAASLTPVIHELIDHYQTIHPDQTITANLASSGSLAKQIAAGAPTDLYISANPKWMAYLDEQGAIDHTTIISLTHNSLVCAGYPNATITNLESLTTVDKIALGNPKSTPVGDYAQKALEAKQLYQPLLAGGQLIFAKDVRQAVVYAEQQLVDVIFVYATDAAASKKIETLFTVPVELYPTIIYPMALTISGSDNKHAQQFYQFLSSATGQQIFHKYGFK